MRRILLENRQLVTKGKDLRLQGGTGLKTGGYQGEKGDEKRAHRGSEHDRTNDRNLCIFRSDGIFGKHNLGQAKRKVARHRPLSRGPRRCQLN